MEVVRETTYTSGTCYLTDSENRYSSVDNELNRKCPVNGYVVIVICSFMDPLASPSGDQQSM